MSEPAVHRTAARFLIKAGYFGVGDKILYGKYKNKVGILKAFGQDHWGNPTIEVEPVPKGRKQNKVIGLYKIWRADVKEKALAEQAKVPGGAVAGNPDVDDDLDDEEFVVEPGVNPIALRVAARYLAARAEPVVQLEVAIKVFESTGDLKPLHAAFTGILQLLVPGGKFPSWYQTLAPQKRRVYQVVRGATESALKALANAEKGVPLVDRFRTSLPLYVKELEKLNAALEATHETAVLTHGPWKIHNMAGFDEATMTEVFPLLDQAGSHLHGKFHKVLYGAIYLGNTVGGFGALANYLIENDTVQVNMKAFNNGGSEHRTVRVLPDMIKTFIHELGHRYWYKFMTKAQRMDFKRLSIEPGYAEIQTHYNHALKSRIADEYIEFVRTPKTRRKQKTWSPELVGWLRDMHADGRFAALDHLFENEPTAEDKMRALIMAGPDKTLSVQGEKLRDGISVSDYGRTNVGENFAEGFAYYALKLGMHPDMVHFFDNLG